MGIYIFTWKALRERLIADEANPESENDFGKNIIPGMLGDGMRMFVHPFEGYWKDVGTIDSLWEANMDMLAPDCSLHLDDPSWRIYSRHPASPPHYIAPGGVVQHSMVSEGCEISGRVEASVLFNDVRIGKGAQVRYSILMPGTEVAEDAVVEFSILAENVHVGRGAHVGGGAIDPLGSKITVAAEGSVVGDGMEIAPGTMLG